MHFPKRNKCYWIFVFFCRFLEVINSIIFFKVPIKLFNTEKKKLLRCSFKISILSNACIEMKYLYGIDCIQFAPISQKRILLISKGTGSWYCNRQRKKGWNITTLWFFENGNILFLLWTADFVKGGILFVRIVCI